jgi:GAF domain-containing protein
MENTFEKNIIPDNEEARLRALYRYQLLENLPERYFTNLARIIAQTFNTPIALVSLVDKEQVNFPGNYGMGDTRQVPRGLSLCSLAVLEENPTIFEDAGKDPCLLANPLVSGSFGLRFYAGAPIVTEDGYAIGTVCVVDKKPRTFSEPEKQMLQEFARTVMQELDIRLDMLR